MYKVIERIYIEDDEVILKFKSNQLIAGEIPHKKVDVLITLDELSKQGLKIHECIKEICDEAGIKLRKKKVRICEGGGWTSAGHEYHYDGIYCEF